MYLPDLVTMEEILGLTETSLRDRGVTLRLGWGGGGVGGMTEYWGGGAKYTFSY